MIQEKIIRGDYCSLVSQYNMSIGWSHFLCVGATFVRFQTEKTATEIFEIIEQEAVGTQGFSGSLSWGNKIANAAASKLGE